MYNRNLAPSTTFRASIVFLLTSAFAAAGGNELPIAFEPEANGHFSAHGRGFALELSASEARIRAPRAGADFRMQVAGANPAARLHPEDKLPGIASHFNGTDRSQWRTNLPTYRTVRAESVYPGIDLVFHGAAKLLEYDFVVAPGANPRDIRLRFSGLNSLRKDAQGNLILATPLGEMTQHKPRVYQTIAGMQSDVPGSFVIGSRNEVSFRIGTYDRRAPLVIDPTLIYSSFLGGGGDDDARSIATDVSGNTYIAGLTTSTNNGDADIFVQKISGDGTKVLYTATVGGSADDYGNGIAVDTNGIAYVVGSTFSGDFPLSSKAFQAAIAGNEDAVVFSLDPTGANLGFSTYMGGGDVDQGLAIALDVRANVYITGSTHSDDFPTHSGAFSTKRAGGIDGFVASFNSDGTAYYSTFIGGEGDDAGGGIAADASGNAYVTGSTRSDGFPVAGNAFQRSRSGNIDAFVLKLDPLGDHLIYSTFLGGSAFDFGNGIAIDGSANAYVVGVTASSKFPVSGNAYQRSYQGDPEDIFVAKVNADGSQLLYSTFLGTHADDYAYAIAVNGSGEAFISGETNSDQYPVTGDAQQKNRKGGLDGVISKLSADGSQLLYSTFWGGSNDDGVEAIAVDGFGGLYFAGYTGSGDYPVTGGTFQPSPGGGPTDAFVASLQFPAPTPVINPGGIGNAAGNAGPVAPGSLASIYGINLAGITAVATATPLSTSLANTQVTVNDIAAPLVYVSGGQINFQVPYGTSPGAASVVVTVAQTKSAAVSVNVSQAAPGIFVSGNRAIAQNADGSTNSTTNPVKTGSVIVVYFTGLGAATPAVDTGSAAPITPLSGTALPCSATVAGQPVATLFCGLTPGFVGLAQANIPIPSLAGTGDQPITLSIGGAVSNNPVIAITR